jgi:hydrogenase expression/formation protein HypE
MSTKAETRSAERGARASDSILGPQSSQLACPVLDPAAPNRILLAHGEGGRLMRRLIREQILPTVQNQYLAAAGDAAVLPACQGQLAMTTDSFVVSPLFFPGGDIGSLAVYGTVNDLAVAGAVPRWISMALILEEGLELDVLRRVLASVAAAAQRVGVPVVAGDTKVVPRGAADKLFINTTGIGELVAAPPPGPAALEVGDKLIVTGPIGRHGMAVMVAREGLAFNPPPTSDSAPLVEAVAALRRENVPVRALRDATRGGLAAVLHEWAEASGRTLAINEALLPVTDEVRGACELLGLDPVHVANEGTMIVAIPAGQADRAIEVLRRVPESTQAAFIGGVEPNGLAPVVVRRATGRIVPLDEPVGAPLPRIC